MGGPKMAPILGPRDDTSDITSDPLVQVIWDVLTFCVRANMCRNTPQNGGHFGAQIWADPGLMLFLAISAHRVITGDGSWLR